MKYLNIIIKFFILFLVFIFRLYFSFPNCSDKNSICYYKRYEEINVSGIVNTEIDGNFSKKIFDVRVFEINNKKINGIIKVNYYGKKEIKFYDKISFLCKAKNIEGNYKKYLENKNIYILCDIKDFNYYNINEDWLLKIKYKIFNFTYNVKRIIINRINNIYNEKYSGFLISFLLGDKRFVSKRIENLMINAGLSHITSISGFNVNLIISFLYFILVDIGINRRKIFYLIIPILIFFTIITGFNPPVLRAVIMSIVILFIQQVGRPYDPLFILLFVGYMMLIFNPKYVFDISFLLSFFSTFAIIFIKPKIDNFIPDRFDFISLKENISSTVSVFIITSPIVFIFFNKLNFLSIINNILVLPFITYLYLFSFLSLIISPISFITCFILDYLFLIIGS